MNDTVTRNIRMLGQRVTMQISGETKECMAQIFPHSINVKSDEIYRNGSDYTKILMTYIGERSVRLDLAPLGTIVTAADGIKYRAVEAHAVRAGNKVLYIKGILQRTEG